MSKARNIANGIGGGTGNVTDAEKAAWNAKQAALVSGSNIKTINGLSLLGPDNITISGGTGGGTASSVAWADVTGKPSTFPPSTHNHTISDVTGLGAALAAASGGTTPYYTASPTTAGTNTYVLDAANGLHQKITITGSSVPNISFTGWPASGTSAIMMVDFVGLGAAATVTWPTAMTFMMPNGSTGVWSAHLSAYGYTLQTTGTDRLLVMTQAGNTALLGRLWR